MAVIAVAGTPGAPGATTSALALLLAWPLPEGRRVLLAECDPDGGAVLAGALEGRVEAVYGLRNLAVADRRGRLAEELWEQLVDLSPGGAADRLLLPGLTDPAQAVGLAYTWEPLAEAFQALEQHGYDVVVDLGRSGAHGAGAPLARRADAVLLTVRSTLRGLSAARPRLAALRDDLDAAGTGADALGLLLVEEGPYPAADVSRELGAPVLGLLPYAPRTARVLSDGGETTDRRFVRSELMRAARSAADEVRLLAARRRVRLAPGAAAPRQDPPPPGPLPYGAAGEGGAARGGAPYGGAVQGAVPYGSAPGGGTGAATGPLTGLAPQPPAPAPFPPHAAPQPGSSPAPFPGQGTDPYGTAPYGGAPSAAAPYGPAAGHAPSAAAPNPFAAGPAHPADRSAPAHPDPFATSVPPRPGDGVPAPGVPYGPLPGPVAPQPAPPAPFPPQGGTAPRGTADQGEEVLRAR
ncbi:hypothetical protein LO771_02910 [Streptacidiphilus sp. ASG 303]|uniref:hypothetical protein n=1 Tax=Streptacidiphilus sp. ASG 303 TaxID=2896847 RepID=UPI001E310EC0|nr:hypothetical protein [Streptacidiphilus sp. ASG 303]MCD0481384.1 hypothetical protein [Streptacidiphilus sp. ASG 303]